jgi:glycopeptide antibiotics resistance protein
MNNTIINIIDLTWPMVFISLAIAVSLRVTYLFKNKCELSIYKELLLLSFLIYILSLFQIVTFQDVSWAGSNFVPLKEILRYQIGSNLFFKNVLGNMLMFIPYGFFISYFLKYKKIWSPLVLIFIASLAIEITQLLIGRVFDIDDLFLNILGGILGYLIYRLAQKIKNSLPSKIKVDMLLNIISVSIIIVMLIILTIVVKGTI